jgi:hypothetical protein
MRDLASKGTFRIVEDIKKSIYIYLLPFRMLRQHVAFPVYTALAKFEKYIYSGLKTRININRNVLETEVYPLEPYFLDLISYPFNRTGL